MLGGVPLADLGNPRFDVWPLQYLLKLIQQLVECPLGSLLVVKHEHVHSFDRGAKALVGVISILEVHTRYPYLVHAIVLLVWVVHQAQILQNHVTIFLVKGQRVLFVIGSRQLISKGLIKRSERAGEDMFSFKRNLLEVLLGTFGNDCFEAMAIINMAKILFDVIVDEVHL